MQVKMQKLPPEYDDDSKLASISRIQYLLRSQNETFEEISIIQYKKYTVPTISSENAPFVMKQFGMEVTHLRSSLVTQLLEKDRTIHDLTVKLKEFERKRSFAPRHHRLPPDYYDNDIYLDE
jgi:hypothetical protein